MSSLWERLTGKLSKSQSAALGVAAAVTVTGMLAWKTGLIEWTMAEVGLALSKAAVRRRKSRRPEYIILVRHGESVGNIDPSIHATVPDHRLHLTEKGRQQAKEAGVRLKAMLGDRRVKFFVSPHRRANETLAHMLHSFPNRDQYRIRVDPRLREQEFGNLQDEMRMKHTVLPMRARFGRFFWRFQGGESGADVYDRITSFLDTLYRDIDSTRHRRSDAVVIVCHGLTMRLFVMRYMRWSVAFFETVSNPRNTEFWTLAKNHAGSYDLITNIRRRRNARRPLPVGRRSWLVNPQTFINPTKKLLATGTPALHLGSPTHRRGRRGSASASAPKVLGSAAAAASAVAADAQAPVPDTDDASTASSDSESGGDSDSDDVPTNTKTGPHEDEEDDSMDDGLDEDDDDDGDGGDDDDDADDMA